MQEIEAFRDKVFNDIQNLSITFEVGLKNLSDQKYSLKRNVKEYITKVFVNFKSEFVNELTDIKDSIEITKLENGKYHLEAMKLVKSQKEKADEFSSLSEGLFANWKNGLESIKGANHNCDQIRKEWEVTEKDHSKILDELKVDLIVKI